MSVNPIFSVKGEFIDIQYSSIKNKKDDREFKLVFSTEIIRIEPVVIKECRLVGCSLESEWQNQSLTWKVKDFSRETKQVRTGNEVSFEATWFIPDEIWDECNSIEKSSRYCYVALLSQNLTCSFDIEFDNKVIKKVYKSDLNRTNRTIYWKEIVNGFKES